MRLLFFILSFICLSNVSLASRLDVGQVNHLAPNPQFEVFTSGDNTQITYTNGDPVNEEIFIVVCNSAEKSAEVQYYIKYRGKQVTTANYITMLRYPEGWSRMGRPYRPPSEVLYDGGMGLNKTLFAQALKTVWEGEDSNIVFSFEGLTSEYNTETKAWSDIIPSSIFKRDLANKNISGCSHTDERELLPLLRIDHED